MIGHDALRCRLTLVAARCLMQDALNPLARKAAIGSRRPHRRRSRNQASNGN
jgi:hypothetical protein